MERIPVDRLLGGVRPTEIRVARDVPEPGSPMPESPEETRQAILEMIRALLRIPGMREILLIELQKAQSGTSVLDRARMVEGEEEDMAPRPVAGSFLEKLRQMRGE